MLGFDLDRRGFPDVGQKKAMALLSGAGNDDDEVSLEGLIHVLSWRKGQQLTVIEGRQP